MGRHVDTILNGGVHIESDDILPVSIFQERFGVISAFLSDPF
jgi:hypothetical protein